MFKDNVWELKDDKLVLSHPQWEKASKKEEDLFAEEALWLYNLQRESRYHRKLLKNWGCRKQSLGRSGDLVSLFIDAEIPGYCHER
jgi:hypothetical protein